MYCTEVSQTKNFRHMYMYMFNVQFIARWDQQEWEVGSNRLYVRWKTNYDQYEQVENKYFFSWCADFASVSCIFTVFEGWYSTIVAAIWANVENLATQIEGKIEINIKHILFFKGLCMVPFCSVLVHVYLCLLWWGDIFKDRFCSIFKRVPRPKIFGEAP